MMIHEGSAQSWRYLHLTGVYVDVNRRAGMIWLGWTDIAFQGLRTWLGWLTPYR